MTLTQFVNDNLAQLMLNTIEKIEGWTEHGHVKMYKCGTIIRIDLKPGSKYD